MGIFRRKQDVPDVIDLRDSVVARTPSFEFGFPTRCGECGGRGYLDHIDPYRRVQFEHCVDCGAKWEHSEDELLTLNG